MKQKIVHVSNLFICQPSTTRWKDKISHSDGKNYCYNNGGSANETNNPPMKCLFGFFRSPFIA